MKILINDFLQLSDAPKELTTPALLDTCIDTNIDIDLGSTKTFNSIGIGYTDATIVTITYRKSIDGNILDNTDNNILDNNDLPITSVIYTTDIINVNYLLNGLYILPVDIIARVFNLSHNGTYIGRVAIGLYREICTSPSKEPGFYSTNDNMISSAGQVLSGQGGYSGRKINVETRYKITSDIYQDFTDAYKNQISKGFPFFINFGSESFKLPFQYFYGSLKENDLNFTNSINRFLYSNNFNFIERF